MYSAFGVDHGDIEKFLNPMKALGGAKKAKSAAGGFNEATRFAGVGAAKAKPKPGMGQFTGSGPAQKALPKAQQATMEERSRAGGVGRLGVRNYSGNTRIRGGGF